MERSISTDHSKRELRQLRIVAKAAKDLLVATAYSDTPAERVGRAWGELATALVNAELT